MNDDNKEAVSPSRPLIGSARRDQKTTVSFREEYGSGTAIFSTWAEAMHFIFEIERREKFNPIGRFAKVKR